MNPIDFKKAFEALPGINILINTNQPDYTVLAVSQGLIDIQPGVFKRTNIIDQPFFKAFPQSDVSSAITNEENIKISFEYVISNKQTHKLDVQLYEVKNETGTFNERWWKTINKPVLNDEGEVVYIIQSSVEITDEILANKKAANFSKIDKAYQLFMNAPVAVCIVKGSNYIVELINEEMLQLVGRSQNVINRPLIESLPEADMQGLIKILDVVTETGKPYHVSTFPATLMIDGKREDRYFDLAFQPYFNELNNKDDSIFCQAYNVTEQVLDRIKLKEITESLNYRNAIFEAQKEATPDGVNVVDTNGKIILYNQRFADIWEMPKEVIESKDDEAALKHAMTLLKDPEEFIKRVTDLYREKKDKSIDEIFFKDGRVIERYGSPIIGLDNINYGWAWYFRDITERKKAAEVLAKSEARTRLAIEATRLGTFDVNIIEETVIYSPRVSEIFGLPENEVLPYEIFKDAILEEDRDIRLKAHGQAIKSGELFYEVRIVRPDKAITWIRLNGKYSFLNNKPVSFVGTVLDITEEKKAADLLEFKIQERTLELKQANDQLQQFTYAASHDLQEPLRKISFFLDRLITGLGTDLNEENKQMADRITRTTARMRNLIDDLLQYSNSTFGLVTFEKTNLNEIAKDVMEDMEATILETNAKVIIEDLPVVNGDPRQLKQLFQNLIANAFKYQKKDNAPVVKISSELVKRKSIYPTSSIDKNEDSFFKIMIEDNGIGFEQEFADRIFKLFQRLHSKKEYEGTGVGLALVKKVIENHNGFITVDSTLDKGTIFNIFLPKE